MQTVNKLALGFSSANTTKASCLSLLSGKWSRVYRAQILQPDCLGSNSSFSTIRYRTSDEFLNIISSVSSSVKCSGFEHCMN